MAKGLGKGINALFTKYGIRQDEQFKKLILKKLDQILISQEKYFMKKQLKN